MRKRLGKEKIQNEKAKDETSIIWRHSVFGFCPSFYHALSCQIVTYFARFQASAAK